MNIIAVTDVDFKWPWNMCKYKNIQNPIVLLRGCKNYNKFLLKSRSKHIFILEPTSRYAAAHNCTNLYNRSIIYGSDIIIGCADVDWLKGELLNLMIMEAKQKIIILLKYDVQCDLSDYHGFLNIFIIRGKF